MVNTENFSKRLSKILEYYDLSAASFADGMNVGRSSISHILSGRNKPSLDFVMKVVATYPEVELYWLLNGEGNFPKQTKVHVEAPKDLFSSTNENNPQDLSGKEIVKPTTTSLGKKEIKKVILIYADGTFEAFQH